MQLRCGRKKPKTMGGKHFYGDGNAIALREATSNCVSRADETTSKVVSSPRGNLWTGCYLWRNFHFPILIVVYCAIRQVLAQSLWPGPERYPTRHWLGVIDRLVREKKLVAVPRSHKGTDYMAYRPELR